MDHLNVMFYIRRVIKRWLLKRAQGQITGPSDRVGFAVVGESSAR